MRQIHVLLFFLLLLGSCSKDPINKSIQELEPIFDEQIEDSWRLNQLQYLGSHNSYKIKTDQGILNFLSGFQSAIPYNVDELDYTHVSIPDQLSKYGIRQFEIDIYADELGGRFVNRMGYRFIDATTTTNVADLYEPGSKVLHIPDIDFNTHYHTFVQSLESIKAWSNEHPFHIPIFIMIEHKESSLADNDILAELGFTKAEPWSYESLARMQHEILSVFPYNQIIKPLDVQGSAASLNEAILNDGWPTIGECRGKVLFFFNNEDITEMYHFIESDMADRIVFTNAAPGTEHAAIVLRNNAFNSEIPILVEEGYLVRTRSDAGTYEARVGDYSSWIQALESGAQFISTDYYKADFRAGSFGWSDYHVSYENGLCRVNPITGF